MKIKILFVLAVLSTNLLAQGKREVITGKVCSDSVFIDNINIINKNNKIGTVSNHKGIFNIPVKINDTLRLSGIQFDTQNIVIRSGHLNGEILIIHLTQKTNELKEVKLKSNTLSGNLSNDINKVKTTSNIALGVLDFSNFNLKPNIIGYGEGKKEEPAASKLTNPHIPIGLTLVRIRLGKTYKKKVLPVQFRIRKEFKDDFFIKTLKIPLVRIDLFLDHCKQKLITELYEENKKLEFTDALIKESKIYLKKIKSEN